jgi:PKD repeat protein
VKGNSDMNTNCQSQLFGTSLLAVLLCTAPCALAQHHVAPPKPAVAPLIGEHYSNDADGDRIDDELVARAQRAMATERAATTPAARAQARARLDEPVNVELVFKQPITQQQLDTFEALGGEITYVYKSVSYGWNARIPLNKIRAVPAAMGATFVLLHQGREMKGDLDEATRGGRVRPVWAAGFAGQASGYAGTTNITIAFMDSGLDETHIDLSGRGVYWTNFTDEPSPTPTDLNGHGSHVAGIALGTGAAGGASGALFFTQFDDLYRGGGTNTIATGSFNPTPLHLPTSTATFRMTVQWLGGATTSFNRYSHTNGDLNWNFANTPTMGTTNGPSPLSLAETTLFNPSRAYSPGLRSVGGPTLSNYVVMGVVSNFPAIDSFNRLRGVAPGCNWAAAKTARANNKGDPTWSGAALDDLVGRRIEKRIKIINISQTADGIDVVMRQKVNSAVMNGVLVVTGTGNTGKLGTTAEQQARDPSRAALALTVCAANDINQVTDYTSTGFYAPDSTPGQEEDYKPDLMAPGGSDYYSFILSVDSNNNDGPAFSDQRTNDYTGMKGTSMAVPFASGCAALVIEAMERGGVVWDFNSSDHPRFVKMVLSATASESNTNREGNLNNPTLQRAGSITNGLEILPAGKDLYEGYGMISADAAVEAVSLTYASGTVATSSLGPSVTDRRVWARTVNLPAGRNFNVVLTNPAAGDFDLYLYSATPSAYGTPVLLAASTQAGNGAMETLNYTPASDQGALLVVKRVSGSGTFSLLGNVAPAVDFIADVTSGLAPLTVNFTNLTTGATSNFWDFGDGNTSTSKDASNIYASAGTYTVTLTATGPGGTNTLAQTDYIVVTNLPLPAVDFVASPTNGFAPLTVAFSNLTSGAITYAWSFGDGNTSADEQPANTYTNPGAYAVTLIAVGPGGTNTLSRSSYILVAPLPVMATYGVSGDDLVISFDTIPGKVYVIEYKDSLADPAWQTLQTVPGDGASKTITISIADTPQRFFRLRVL